MFIESFGDSSSQDQDKFVNGGIGLDHYYLMADQFRRGKKAESPVPWLVLVVHLLIPTVCAFSNTVHIYPKGVILVRHSQALEVFCTSTDDHSADFLQFEMAGVLLPSEKINDTTIRLFKKMDDKGVYSYYCVKMNCGRKCRRKIAGTRIIVDGPPHNVTDFQCKSYNLDHLDCTWTVPKSFSIINYTLAIVVSGMRMDISTLCDKRIGSSYHCTLSNVRVPRYRQLERQYYFTLTSSNVFGINEQNYTVDHYSVVQPAPVTDLRVRDIGAYSAELQWRLPNNVIDLLPDGVTHKIEYQIAKIDNTSYFRTVDTSSLPPKNLTYRFLLSLPYAHSQYEVRIFIRPVQATGEEYWSKYTYVVFYTGAKSTAEISKSIYNHWRKDAKGVSKAFRAKWRHMKAQKHLYSIWQQREHGTLSLMPLLISGTNGS